MDARSSSRPGGPRRAARLPVVLAVALTGLLAAFVALRFLGPDDTAGSDTTSASSATSTPTATAPSSPTPRPTPTTTPTARAAGALPVVDRLTADDRYALSVAASRRTIATGAATPVAYLVADDALDLGWAAVPAAAARGGVVLLTDPDRLPEVVAAEIARLDPSEIVLVGSTASVADAVESAAARLAPRVVRVDTADPADTAREVTRTAFPTASEVWVASAGSTSDLATASAVAAGRRAPVLVLREGAVSPDPSDVTLLRALGAAEVTLIGADTSLATAVEQSLRSALPAATISRVGGSSHSRAASAHRLAWDGAPAAMGFVANGGWHTYEQFLGRPATPTY